MNEIIVNEATKSDWEDSMELAWKTFLKFEAPIYTKEGVNNFLNLISDEKLFKMFLCGNYKLVVAKCDEKIVGMGSVRAGSHISLLFVDERYQRLNIGKRILAYLQKIVEKETKSFCMTVNAAPVATGFYEKLGFLNVDSEKSLDGITFQPMEIFKRIETNEETNSDESNS